MLQNVFKIGNNLRSLNKDVVNLKNSCMYVYWTNCQMKLSVFKNNLSVLKAVNVKIKF